MDLNATFYNDEEDIDLLYEDDAPEVSSLVGMSPEDAYVYSMRNMGRVDLYYMSSISGIDEEDLVEALKGKCIFPDPSLYEKYGDYMACFTSKDQYLRGNLIKKYEQVCQANEETSLFSDTLNLLLENMPLSVDPNEIHMNLGAPWIPETIVAGFIKNLLEMYGYVSVTCDEFLGKWIVKPVGSYNFVHNNYTYGTSRMNAVSIISHILNARPVKVYDRLPKADGSGYESILNQAETLAAQEKEKLIIAEWNTYLHEDERVLKNLQEQYMQSFGYGITRFDGSFLNLPGLNPNIHLYDHQRNAIARIVLNNNTLLAHKVGAGKTIEYSCGVHELIRMKLGKKALIVVPNSTFGDAVNAYRDCYEDDVVLAVYKKDFTPDKRANTLKEMASDKYQVIFMSYSSFDMITVSMEEDFAKRERQIHECAIRISNAKSYALAKALRTEHTRLNKSFEKYKENYKQSNTACFDKLGVDILVVDESHNYKNISLDNKTDNIVGVHNAGAKKADNMLAKVEYIQSINGHVIFATGTPITNSMADLYILQRYLQPEELKLSNIYHFNEWVNTFCSQTHSFEVDVDSKNYRFTTRFSKFHNLPEIMSMFSDVCDFYQMDDGELGLPDFRGYTDILVNKSAAQKDYIDDIARRTEDIRARRVSRKKDNLLKITVDGRMCALDIRLVKPMSLVTGEDTKVGAAARQILDIYHTYPDTTQIVFSDIATPKDSFNVYDELKDTLVNMGIPEDQIAFIHDADTEAKRNKIEKAFNKGTIRVLIGSTMKLGTGCNVQERLIAVHHLDVPWRPADMVQREGRILRQGNTNKEVKIFRYVTDASFDSYTWQILENKQRFIAQFLSGSLDALHRDESDCADTVLNYAEIKALAIGNPIIKERVETSNELEHARINQRQKRKELANLKELLDAYPRQIENQKLYIANAKADRDFYQSVKVKVSADDRRLFGEPLLEALKGNIMREESTEYGEYQGFKVMLPKHMNPDKPYVVVSRTDSNQYKIKMDGDKALGCSKRIDYVLDHLDDTISEKLKGLDDLYRQKELSEETIANGNEFDDEVYRLIGKLEVIDKLLKEAEAS